MPSQSKGEIFLVEDERTQLRTLTLALERSGFEVWPASNVEEAEKLIDRTIIKFDVSILDMLLEDLRRPHVTGGDIGKLLKARQRKSPPEFLIYSAYERPRFYRQALELGAAGYLKKPESTVHDVVRHTVTLTARRRLQDLGIVTEINRNLSRCRRKADAVRIFSERILVEKLAQVLNNPFLLLATEIDANDEVKTVAYGYDVDLPSRRAKTFATIAGLAFSSVAENQDIKIRVSDIANLVPSEEKDLLAMLEGAAFVPLIRSDDVRLTLGILPSETGDKDVSQLAILLKEHLQSILGERMSLMSEILENRNTTLSSLGKFCLYIGQKQLGLAKTAEYQSPSPELKRLVELTHQLTQTGQRLADLSVGAAASPDLGEIEQRDSVSVDETVLRVWDDLLPLANIDRSMADILDVQGTCQAAMEGDDLYVAVAGVLRWLARKGRPLAHSGEACFWVTCTPGEEFCEIRFEDSNTPLPTQLSESLFEPFSFMDHGGTGLELFTLRTLIQVRYGGAVTHEPYQSDSRSGNRLILLLPARSGVSSQEDPAWTTAS